jgi:hypothetical protein
LRSLSERRGSYGLSQKDSEGTSGWSIDRIPVDGFARPLLERAGLVEATNEAWAMIAALVLLAPIILTLSGLMRTAVSVRKKTDPPA